MFQIYFQPLFAVKDRIGTDHGAKMALIPNKPAAARSDFLVVKYKLVKPAPYKSKLDLIEVTLVEEDTNSTICVNLKLCLMLECLISNF